MTCEPVGAAGHHRGSHVGAGGTLALDRHAVASQVEIEVGSTAARHFVNGLDNARVEAARVRQRARFTGTPLTCNADMGPGHVRRLCALEGAAQAVMRAAMTQLSLSARAYHRVLKLSRTIADLADADEIGAAHLAEALQYQPRGRG